MDEIEFDSLYAAARTYQDRQLVVGRTRIESLRPVKFC